MTTPPHVDALQRRLIDAGYALSAPQTQRIIGAAMAQIPSMWDELGVVARPGRLDVWLIDGIEESVPGMIRNGEPFTIVPLHGLYEEPSERMKEWQLTTNDTIYLPEDPPTHNWLGPAFDKTDRRRSDLLRTDPEVE